MKVYQLIYTSVQNCLSDSELGLTNQPGQRVYSCSQGLTKDNIQEIIRFSNYRLPRNNNVTYSEIIGDPTIPEMFPKIFRTLKLSDGKYAAIQSVYSGVDFQGRPGNFFAHALIFDDVSDDFFPEQYCGSSVFKTYLTTKEAERKLVHYLPVLEDLQPEEDLIKEIPIFIKLHKEQMTYILEKAFEMLSSNILSNICISTNDEYLTQKYLLALKWLLPRNIRNGAGISTYNVYVPSDKQKKIAFHGTIKGKNNITQQSIEARESCIYIDIENTKVNNIEISPLIEMGVDELRKEYNKYNFDSSQQISDWLETRSDITKPGMGGKLLRLKASGGDEIFAKRAAELYDVIENEEMKTVRFEISKVMFDNIDLFPSLTEKITDDYMTQCIERLCHGEKYDIDNFVSEKNQEQAKHLKEKMPDYMQVIRRELDNIGTSNKNILLGFMAQVKHVTGDETWKEFFGSDKNLLKVFITLASVIITGYGVRAFSPPESWNDNDLCEVIAYFESSTKQKKIKDSCMKYMYFNEHIDWEKYGITFTKHKKTIGEQEKDIDKIQSLLRKVGYIPYNGSNYDSIKREVTNDIYESRSPLLLSRLLDAFYRWKSTYGNQAEARKRAEKLRSLMLEMRRTEISCYDFIIPKLALEIIESPGHYHEMMINTVTMPQSFWNWFLIGYENCGKDEEKMLNYTRIYQANRVKLLRLPVRKKMKAAFKNIE